jgi:hypothetical protein
VCSGGVGFCFESLFSCWSIAGCQACVLHCDNQATDWAVAEVGGPYTHCYSTPGRVCGRHTAVSTQAYTLPGGVVPVTAALRFETQSSREHRRKALDHDFMRSTQATHAGSTFHGSYTVQSLGPRPGVSSAAAAEGAVLIVPHARRALRRTSTQALVNTQTHPYSAKSPHPLIMVGKSAGQLRPNPAHMITQQHRQGTPALATAAAAAVALRVCCQQQAPRRKQENIRKGHLPTSHACGECSYSTQPHSCRHAAAVRKHPSHPVTVTPHTQSNGPQPVLAQHGRACHTIPAHHTPSHTTLPRCAARSPAERLQGRARPQQRMHTSASLSCWR